MCVRCGSGVFFFLFREGLVEFEVWVGSSSLVSGLGVVVCVSMKLTRVQT